MKTWLLRHPPGFVPHPGVWTAAGRSRAGQTGGTAAGRPGGIRYASPNGSIFQLANGNLGLFYGAGNCLDGDSDGFHAIVYAETSPASLLNWTIVNNITTNPIASIAPMTANGTTYPTSTPVVGNAQPWFDGRVYAPMAMFLDATHVNLIFNGYDAGYVGGSDYTSYRTVGHVTLQIGNNTIQ